MASTENRRLVDLSPDEHGDRIALVTDGHVSYLQARRYDLGARHRGSAGHCRYIRRASDGMLYVTGPGMNDAMSHSDGVFSWTEGKRNIMFESADEGRTWTGRDLHIENLWYLGAFTILRDDTFLVAFMPDYAEFRRIYLARSADRGRTWDVERMDGDIRPYNHIVMDNGHLLELADGTILMTCNLRHRMRMGEAMAELPPGLWGSFAHLFRSADGGRTWGEKSMIALANSAETHLLELSSGKLLGLVRRQRSHRVPGDPSDLVAAMRVHGYDPEYRGYQEPIDEGPEGTALYKSVFLTESLDGGRTWVDERRVSDYEQCSGDLALLADGKTLVAQYDHRYNDRFAGAGVRARVSYDLGRTWAPGEYILGEGENYPGSIALPEGGLMTVCPYRNKGPIQAVQWTPVPQSEAGEGVVPAPGALA